MMGYSFVTLDDEQKAIRRHLLNQYAIIAQWSIFVPLLLSQLAFFARWAVRNCTPDRPRSPHPQAINRSPRTWVSRTGLAFNQLRWWADEPIRRGWFTKGETFLGLMWGAWLLFLCIHQTGNDYLHLTKRFGIVAASQLPLHYLLSMRSSHSPIQLLTRLSYERVIMLHQILGKILTFFFALHAGFYFNFFFQSGLLQKRLREVDVITGIISFIMFSVMSTTALSVLRKWNYRVFYSTHVFIAIIVVDVLIWHVQQLRTYVFEVLAVYIFAAILKGRKMHQLSGTITLIPGTNLVQVMIPVPLEKDARELSPGQHVHLSRPTLGQLSLSGVNSLVVRRRTNPFTIASLPSKDKQLLLVARSLNGNTKRLVEVAKSLRSQSDASTAPVSIPLMIEGPYGASSRFPDFREFDYVLLIAGGVGATFTIPVYRAIVEARNVGENDPVIRARVRFVWAVKRLAETRWAFPKRSDSDIETSDDEQGRPRKSVEVFVTRSPSDGERDDQGLLDDLELAEGDSLLQEDTEKAHGMVVGHGRPNLRAIVDEAFTSCTSKVAVLACGPEGIIEELRQCVKPWVFKQRDVFWHHESFGV